jgi:bacteriorhodopsin
VLIITVAAPWTATLSEPQHILITYFLVIAALALFVGFLRAWLMRGEIGARYRTATVARLGITGVAFLSYVFLVAQFATAYERVGDEWVPGPDAILTMAARYMDWSITVPLLTVELLVMTSLAGFALRRTMAVAMIGAFFMIFAGFVGAFVVGGGEDETQLYLWGAISCLFWIGTTLILIRAVRQSLPVLTWESAAYLRSATILLLSGWVIYPLLYLVPLFAFGGAWTTVIQVGLSITDILIKIGFGTLIHSVAKLRTAEDVRAGDDVHEESIWISSVKQSDAGSPREVFLADGASAHRRRAAPPTNSAVASPLEEPVDL